MDAHEQAWQRCGRLLEESARKLAKNERTMRCNRREQSRAASATWRHATDRKRRSRCRVAAVPEPE